MTTARARKPAASLDQAGLYDYAVKALGRRMRTEAELRRLLAARVSGDEQGRQTVAAVVARLREHGYLNDAAYAEAYARLRQENEKLGARRVRQTLAQRGIAAEIVEEAVEARYAGTDEVALARQHLERKRIGRPANQKETARVMRRLSAAGFAPGIIYKVLRAWDAPEEALAALDQFDGQIDDKLND